MFRSTVVRSAYRLVLLCFCSLAYLGEHALSKELEAAIDGQLRLDSDWQSFPQGTVLLDEVTQYKNQLGREQVSLQGVKFGVLATEEIHALVPVVAASQEEGANLSRKRFVDKSLREKYSSVDILVVDFHKYESVLMKNRKTYWHIIMLCAQFPNAIVVLARETTKFNGFWVNGHDGTWWNVMHGLQLLSFDDKKESLGIFNLTTCSLFNGVYTALNVRDMVLAASEESSNNFTTLASITTMGNPFLAAYDNILVRMIFQGIFSALYLCIGVVHAAALIVLGRRHKDPGFAGKLQYSVLSINACTLGGLGLYFAFDGLAMVGYFSVKMQYATRPGFFLSMCGNTMFIAALFYHTMIQTGTLSRSRMFRRLHFFCVRALVLVGGLLALGDCVVFAFFFMGEQTVGIGENLPMIGAIAAGLVSLLYILHAHRIVRFLKQALTARLAQSARKTKVNCEDGSKPCAQAVPSNSQTQKSLITRTRKLMTRTSVANLLLIAIALFISLRPDLAYGDVVVSLTVWGIFLLFRALVAFLQLAVILSDADLEELKYASSYVALLNKVLLN